MKTSSEVVWKMNIKRILFLLLLLHSVLYCQETSTIQSNLTSIEDFAINIEQNSIEQQMQIENLEIELAESQKLLEESKKQQKEMSQTQEALLKQLKSYERKSKNWSTVAACSISLSIITTTTLIIMMKD